MVVGRREEGKIEREEKNRERGFLEYRKVY